MLIRVARSNEQEDIQGRVDADPCWLSIGANRAGQGPQCRSLLHALEKAQATAYGQANPCTLLRRTNDIEPAG